MFNTQLLLVNKTIITLIKDRQNVHQLDLKYIKYFFYLNKLTIIKINCVTFVVIYNHIISLLGDKFY